jgi:hypothetical protein
MTNLEACTDKELEQALARVLTYASGELLNDAEVRNNTSSAKRFSGVRSL